jgi:regulator of sigma E protease
VMVGFLSFVVVFGLLIFVHELGHFVTAKLAGVSVREFGFGYPPRLIKLGQWRETEITLNLLPLGGFVNLSEDNPDAPGSLATKSRRVRALVFVAGAAMNLLLAIVLNSVIFMIGALTPVEGPGAGIYYVAPDSPAYVAGVRPGDTIVSIDNQAIQTVEQVIGVVKEKSGVSIEMVVQREGVLQPAISMIPRLNPPANEGAIGVSLGDPLARQRYPVWEAVPLGLRTTWATARAMYLAVRAAIRQEMPLTVTGPIGIYKTTAEAAKTGIERLIEFAAFLSFNLFLVNLLPLPALDGGRLIFVALEWVRRGRRIPPEKEGMVHAIGMVALIALMVVVTFFDYQRYFG